MTGSTPTHTRIVSLRAIGPVALRQALLASTAILAACASEVPPPEISLDTPTEARKLVEPASHVEVVELPKPLPLPGQLKPLPVNASFMEPIDPKQRIATANNAARVQPTRSGYVNATQVWPYSAGALYQIYSAPEKVTDIALQTGEQLVSVSAGDTVRWIIGDTNSGAGDSQQTHILVKPTRTDLKTNLVINTNRRTYLLELTSTPATWMASVSWDYPHDRLVALQRHNERADTATPVSNDVALERVKFRYEITGDNPSWRPTRVFDDGEKVYIQFPAGIAQGELPPLFVIGPSGDSQLVNYRARPPYYVVDRLFGAAELRLGGSTQQIVRISRTDGSPRGIFGL